MYLYGTDFTLLTDHKPLECIYSTKSTGRASARIHRWVLRLQSYKFKVKYIAGKDNIADSLSRLLCIKLDNLQSQPTNESEKYIRFVALNATPNALTTKEIERASADDEEISEIRECILYNQWHKLSNKKLLAIKDELTCICNPEKPEPIKPTDIPTAPWQHISADLMLLPTGDYLFVVVDYYSRYFEVDTLRLTTADKIVKSLRKMFLTHGLPISNKTDNGPQFISAVFKEYLESQGISHRRVTPLWPQANGEVERQNRTLLKRVRIAQAEKRNWRAEIDKFLIMYRTTPHSVTGVSPAELMFKRKLRTKIPGIQDHVGEEDLEVSDRDREVKGKMKMYADVKRNARECNIVPGDMVLLKRDRKDKLTPTFHSEPFRVVERTGNAVTVSP
ncbi:uncharacterized protein K02A2.6-like [Anneissia japonica]|uniref:uncharacterized protein K02A2.6-like n=1 Tax=Anneissia japonica TaxID=1529436 RepID=UPI001425ACD5|nr:uncharacterized protein K02A2.6-like [Anneissia japonica]